MAKTTNNPLRKLPVNVNKNKNKNMKKLKKVLNKDLFEADYNEEGRFAILLSLMPLLVLTFFMNFGVL